MNVICHVFYGLSLAICTQLLVCSLLTFSQK